MELNGNPKALNKLTEEERDRQVETEIQTAKKIASRLFKVVSNKEFIKEVPDPRMRHQVVTMQLKKMDEQEGTGMYNSFASVYPVVVKYMAQQVAYNSRAFEKFLRAQAKNPGKGMEGFIEHQANYVKLLYIESCKANKKRVNMKEANRRKNEEFERMNKVKKEMERSKKKAENEFEEESKHHMDEKREELLAFVNHELEDYKFSDSDDSSDDDDHSESDSSSEISEETFFNKLTREEQLAKIDTFHFLEETSIKRLGQIDREIKKVKQQIIDTKLKVKESFLPSSIKSSKSRGKKSKKSKKAKKAKK